MQLGNFAVVPPEESQQITGQIVLIFRLQRADNTAIDTNVTGLSRIGSINENIARVHIRMEKAITKYLGEKYFNTPLCQFFSYPHSELSVWQYRKPGHHISAR